MPELPEVQTIVTDLQVLAGDIITGFSSAWQKSLKQNNSPISAKRFAREITGARIKSITRRGKFIIISLSSGKRILIHLRMTGQLLIKNAPTERSKHMHHVFSLKKNGTLIFADVRKFGTLSLISDSFSHPYLATIDPFDKTFSAARLHEILKKKPKATIKAILMDQLLIAGIGNIYASEILFAAKINPLRTAASLSSEEIKMLHQSIQKILTKAIRMRGTSVSDYRDSSGSKGRFQTVLNVYKRDGFSCKKCATMIASVRIAQRSTFYCPTCQK